MRKLIAAFITTTLITACGQASIDDATALKYGELDTHSFMLVKIEPNSTITTCGDYADEAARVIKVWAKAMGRDRYLSINSRCENASYSNNVDAVYTFKNGSTYMPPDGQPVGSYHAEWQGYISARKGCEKPNRYAYATTRLRRVVFCNEYDRGVMIHEVGHLFGMCDLYEEADNCALRIDSGYEGRNKAIMDDGFEMKNLGVDDVMGIRHLALKYQDRFSDEKAWEGYQNWRGYPSNTAELAKEYLGLTSSTSPVRPAIDPVRPSIDPLRETPMGLIASTGFTSSRQTVTATIRIETSSNYRLYTRGSTQTRISLSGASGVSHSSPDLVNDAVRMHLSAGTYTYSVSPKWSGATGEFQLYLERN